MFNGKISRMILTVVFMVSFTFLPGLKADAADPVHTVIPGETVESIARTYDISAEQLMKTNGLPDDRLFAGQKLAIIQTAYTPSVYQWSERGKKLRDMRNLL